MPKVAGARHDDLRNRILITLDEGPIRPGELFEHLQEQKPVSESAVKEVLANLIEARTVELSVDRKIKRRNNP